MKKMNGTIYIRTDDRKYIKKRERCIRFLSKSFIIARCEQVRNGEIILIPKYKCYNEFIKNRLLNQMNSYISESDFSNIIFEDNLSFFEKKMDKENFLNGKSLMKKLITQILDYIFSVSEKNMSLENIYLFVNNYNKTNISIIENLIPKFKTVNIITENLKYYRKLENYLFNKGILITVSNNKKKSARNAKYILNIDFTKGSFEKYVIDMNSILINLTNTDGVFKNKYEGVVVNDFEISINHDIMDFVTETYGMINTKLYIESCLIESEENYRTIEDFLTGYNIKITKLIGLRGILEDREFFN